MHGPAILYRDEHLVVVDKPPGVLSVAAHGERALPELLREQGIAAEPVHRLDRDVSGAIVLALAPAVRTALEDLFRQRGVRKTYWALAAGRVRPAEGRFHGPILEERGMARVSARGKPALTTYRTLAAFASATELEVEIESGRLNQIRVHFAHGGFPLIGERKYARGRDAPAWLLGGRVALHSWRLAFPHPITRTAVEVEAPLPEDLLALRERARGSRAR